MDSNNSGSLQSSSGCGDDDYDPISPFITSAHLRPIPAPPPPLLLDPLPNFIQLQDPNLVWPGVQRPDMFQPPAAPEDNHEPPNSTHTAARNPKKRSRASRRATTTVMTTDTTNFRAMVQEFTGIPTSPFNNNENSSSFPPPYLRRPFPRKVQTRPSFLLNSHNITQNSNIFNSNISPNPFLASLLQTNPKFLFSNSSAMASKDDHSSIKTDGVGVFEFRHDGINHQHVTDNNNNSNNPDEDEDEHDYEAAARMRSINGGYSFRSNTTTSSANEPRGEGMVEPWICSSELK